MYFWIYLLVLYLFVHERISLKLILEVYTVLCFDYYSKNTSFLFNCIYFMIFMYSLVYMEG